MNGIVSLITPLLLHMIISEVFAAVFGNYLDASLCAAVTSLVVIPFAGWMYRKDKKRGWHKSERTEGKNRLYFGVFCFAAGGILNLVWSSILNRIGITQFFSNQVQEELFAAQFGIQLIGLGVLVPVAEELVFRGLIYTRMKQFFPWGLSAVFSGLLFAVYHGNPIQIIFAFPMALALAAVYERGKCFVFPVLFHTGANLTAILIQQM